MSYIRMGMGAVPCTNPKGCVDVTGTVTPEQSAAHLAARQAAATIVSHSGGVSTIVKDTTGKLADRIAKYEADKAAKAAAAAGQDPAAAAAAAQMQPQPSGLFGIPLSYLLIGGGAIAAIVIIKRRKKQKQGGS
jgi:hypothetical protein